MAASGRNGGGSRRGKPRGRETTIDLAASEVRRAAAARQEAAASAKADRPSPVADEDKTAAAPAVDEGLFTDGRPDEPDAAARTPGDEPRPGEASPEAGEDTASSGAAAAETGTPWINTPDTPPEATAGTDEADAAAGRREAEAVSPEGADDALAGSAPAEAGTDTPDRIETAGPEPVAPDGPETAGAEPEPTGSPALEAAAAGAAADETSSDDDPDARRGTAAMPPAAPQRQGSMGSSLLAAAVGGLIVLAGGAALVAGGVLPVGGDREEVAALESRLAELDQRVAALPAAPGGDGDLAGRLDALEQGLAGAAPSGDLAAAVEDLRARVEEIAAAPAGGADLAATGSRLDELAGAVDQLRGELAAAGAGDLAPRVDEIVGAVNALSGRVEEIAAAVSSVSGRMDEMAGAVESLRSDVSGLGQTVTSLGDTVAGREQAVAAIPDLAGRIQAIEDRLAAGPKGGEIAALSLAVTSLASRVAAGEPFAADLAIVRDAAPDIEGLNRLAESAETGVPTVEELAASFPLDAILASRVPSAEGSVVDRLFAGAKSLVNYRETGAVADDPTAAAVSAIEAALAAGDLSAALDAAAALPEPARAAAAGWIADLERRAAAEAVVAGLTDRILTRLQAPAEGQ